MSFAKLCATIILPATLIGGAADAAPKDDLVIGVAQFPSSLHPNINAELVKSYTLGFAIRQITAYDKDSRNSCLLCTELPTLENGLARVVERDGATGMAVTIKLRPDLRWGDGKKVTSHDLAFTWRIARDPRSGFSNPHPWKRASRVEIVNESTAILHLDQVYASFNEWDQILPAHIEEQAFERAPASEYFTQTTYVRAPKTAGLYNGPYIVTEYQSGSHIVLSPNEYWPGTRPGFKRIVIKLVENTAALLANLLSGDVDMVAGEGVGLTVDQVLELRKRRPSLFTYNFKSSLNYEHIDLKKENPFLVDPRVRQALIYAADRKTLTEQLFEGLQPVADTWVNPLNPNHSKEVQTYPYDLSRAKQLLADAGWKVGPDGICRSHNGDRLSFEFSTTAGNRLRELQQQILQSNWRDACIEVRIRNEPARTFFGETLKKRRYQGLAMYAWASGVTESPRGTLASESVPADENGYGGANYVGFANPLMDTLIAQAERELDPGRQKAIWAEMQAIYARELPALPLFFRAEPHVIPNWLRGYVPTGHGDLSTYTSENWYPAPVAE